MTGLLWLQVCELGIKACTAQDLGLFTSRLVGLGLNELKLMPVGRE